MGLKTPHGVRGVLAGIWMTMGWSLSACGAWPFAQDMTLGGETVSAATLNAGYESYTVNCYACHGENGDGQGPAAAYLRPAPRDFRTGVFKFAGVRNPGLPHTEHLVELVQRGLTGTAMLPWDLTSEELTAIVQYIKTFSSDRVPDSAQAWTNETELGEPILPTEDPWRGKPTADAIKTGKEIYHVKAMCIKCHPAYVTQREFWDLTRGDNEWAYGELVYRPQLKKSDAFAGTKILPPDFVFHAVKTVSPEDDDEEVRRRLYQVIAAGIQGAAMPTWKGALTEEELWSLAYYLQTLASSRNTPAARTLRETLTDQPAFVPPDAPESAPPPEPSATPEL